MNTNADLIKLPWFEVTVTCQFGEPSTLNSSNQVLIFYYLNFKNADDVGLFQLKSADIVVDEEIIRVYVMKEGSFGYEEIKQYTNPLINVKQLFLEIRSTEYDELSSRNRLQDIITQLITVPPNFPQLTPEDIINTLAEGRNFVTGNYPENADPSDGNFTSAVKSILKKKDFLESEELVLIIMIRVNPYADSYLNTTEGLKKEFEEFHDFFYQKINKSYIGFYYFIFDDVKSAFNISIIATDKFIFPRSHNFLPC